MINLKNKVINRDENLINNYLGFSWKGLIVFLLPMIPNIFYFLYPAPDGTGYIANNHIVLDILEHGSQAIFILMLIFVMSKQTSKIQSPYVIGMAISLIFYFVLWILYFTGKANLIILLGMAILPVVYFILAEIWLNNYLAIIPTVLFGVVHIIITYINN